LSPPKIIVANKKSNCILLSNHHLREVLPNLRVGRCKFHPKDHPSLLEQIFSMWKVIQMMNAPLGNLRQDGIQSTTPLTDYGRIGSPYWTTTLDGKVYPNSPQ